jgi:hypothetical protein
MKEFNIEGNEDETENQPDLEKMEQLMKEQIMMSDTDAMPDPMHNFAKISLNEGETNINKIRANIFKMEKNKKQKKYKK